MEKLLQGLRAAAEPTRLRIIALCGHAELSVNELATILVQSQPRVSRHLKLLVDGGVLQRNKEGNRAYYRLAGDAYEPCLGQVLNDLIPVDDQLLTLDLTRLTDIKAERVRYAESYSDRYFDEIADLRSMWADDDHVDKYIVAEARSKAVNELLDIGTGAGRVLRLLAPWVKTAIGIDNSREMLSIARARLDQEVIRNCQVRIGDMYHLPFSANRFDLVTINSLLRYSDKPKAVLGEAARVLKPGGTLLVVDLALHELVKLREEYGHRWLGFSEEDMEEMMVGSELKIVKSEYIKGSALTVCMWIGHK
ncbi:MAG: ArsR family transcriptional regulator [Rhodospirillaceae bacterium]|nr:ArsR family transcriptional regulator [Rhodospirillaceae bacterium]